VSMEELLKALRANFQEFERLRQILRNKSPKWGNDDDEADDVMRAAFATYFEAVDRKPNVRGAATTSTCFPRRPHLLRLRLGGHARWPERRAPLSEGISPSQGMDRHGRRR